MRLRYTKKGRLSRELKSLKVDLETDFADIDGTYDFYDKESIQELRTQLRGAKLRAEKPLEIKTESNTETVMSEEIKDVTPIKKDVESIVNSVKPEANTNEPIDYSSFSGFEGEVIEREYNKTPDTHYKGVDIPEPHIKNPTEALLEEEAEKIRAMESEASEEEANETKVTNPQMNELDDKDKKLAAKSMANTILGAYESLHVVAGGYVKMNEGKVAQMVTDGDINGDILIPLDAEGNEGGVMDYVKVFNSDIDNILVVTDEFKESVRPPLERVLEKKGWGMTDEQTLIAYFGKDLALKAVSVYGIKKGQTMVLDSLKEATIRLKTDKKESEVLTPDVITKA